ncbi:MAG TPA: hypothetical protein VJ888_05290 [Mobilitalea sp.]|nr:hypothetical protein [Mobilitalea sp.]
MPIRPIEIMKSQEASQLKHLESNRTHHDQQQLGKSFVNQIQAESSKTTQLNKTENNEFRYDAKEKGQNSYSGSGSKKQDNKDEKNEVNKEDNQEPKKPGSFDVLI